MDVNLRSRFFNGNRRLMWGLHPTNRHRQRKPIQPTTRPRDWFTTLNKRPQKRRQIFEFRFTPFHCRHFRADTFGRHFSSRHCLSAGGFSKAMQSNHKGSLLEKCAKLKLPQPVFITNPSHMGFTCIVTVSWGKFEGSAGNKKSAEQMAAEKALKAFTENEIERTVAQKKTTGPFSRPNLNYKNLIQELCTQEKRIFQGFHAVRVPESPDHSPLFEGSVQIDDQVFLSRSRHGTKKDAENDAGLKNLRVVLIYSAEVAYSFYRNTAASAQTKANYKGMLLEYFQRMRFPAPRWSHASQGPPHMLKWTVILIIEDNGNEHKFISGSFSKKPEAEQDASYKALIYLGLLEDEHKMETENFGLKQKRTEEIGNPIQVKQEGQPRLKLPKLEDLAAQNEDEKEEIPLRTKLPKNQATFVIKQEPQDTEIEGEEIVLHNRDFNRVIQSIKVEDSDEE